MVRYIQIVWAESWLYDEQMPDYRIHSLRRVQVERCKLVLKYRLTPFGDILSETSQELVKPKDNFVICGPTPDYQPIKEHFGCVDIGSFDDECEKMRYDNPKLLSVTNISDEIRAQVIARDGGKYCLTGETLGKENTDVVWILPPAISPELESQIYERFILWTKLKDPEDLDNTSEIYRPTMVPENCLTIHRDFSELFKHNKISVDVINDYQIIQLIDFETEVDLRRLQTHMHQPANENRPTRSKYLEKHFARLLLNKFGCGSMEEEGITRTRIKWYMSSTIKLTLPGRIVNRDAVWRHDRFGRVVYDWISKGKPQETELLEYFDADAESDDESKHVHTRVELRYV
ncbi:hypothetical protein H0H81_000756 [Sphagnurus paluster]|uniref:Uncharacterized protein n=1 Tax=Sphagnurus paluster TaxID=117069 RepID=A0A9P7GGB1_9AGAR|nr:hypothetical protein H0H81_000756 [Sphagnurus paluster]